MKLGARMPFAVDASVGTEFQFDDTPASQVWVPGTEDAASSVIWGSLSMPSAPGPFGWDAASFGARFDPELDQGNFNFSMLREWSLSSLLGASIRDSYSFRYGGAEDSTNHWRTSKSFRLDLFPTGTAFMARILREKDDSVMHTMLRAEQELLDDLYLTTSIADIAAEVPTHSIGARQRLFGLIDLSLSVEDLSADAPIKRVHASFSYDW